MAPMRLRMTDKIHKQNKFVANKNVKLIVF